MSHLKKYWVIILIAFGLSFVVNLALGMLIFGSLIIFIGIETVLFINRIHKTGIESIGKILEFDFDSEGYKTPLIEFLPDSGEYIKGKPYVLASSGLSKEKSNKNMIGQTVSILYDPDEPQKFILTNEGKFRYYPLVILFIVSSIFIIVGISSLLGVIKLTES